MLLYEKAVFFVGYVCSLLFSLFLSASFEAAGQTQYDNQTVFWTASPLLMTLFYRNKSLNGSAIYL